MASDDHARWAASVRRTSSTLKLVLRSLDIVGLVAGWWLAYAMLARYGVAGGWVRVPLSVLGLAGVSTALVVMASKRLWLARVCSVRSTELEGLGQAALLSALFVLAVGQVVDYDAPDRFALLGALNSFVLLVALRSAYAAYLSRARRAGRFARSLVLVGANDQARDLAALIDEHPEAGYVIVGVCAPRDAVDGRDLDLPWLGDCESADRAVERTHASGALVVASALDPLRLNATLRQLLATGCHVHLSSGLRGIAHERLLPQPLAREPLFYVEDATLTRSQRTVKRIMDAILATGFLAVALPVLLLAALAVKLNDGGPVFFTQRRIGLGGRPFTLYKLRTMVPDAERLRAELELDNLRHGPLFKMARDPRITRVGRLLRAASIDELPQLINVIRGDMSLIGPRPALPDEVAQFDDEHRRRVIMLPGMTGLWQVEGRDNPSFDSYRRLDLYYVENWSIGLDLAILLATIGVVTSRSLRSLTSPEVAV